MVSKGEWYMRLKIKEIDIISTVAQTRNMSHAAACLGMQQANVSKYISDLEFRIGLKIFERTSRKISLTDFGSSLLPYINKQLENQKGLNDFICDYKKEKTGTVTIYAPSGIINFVCNEIVPGIKDIGNVVISLKTRNPFNNEHNEGLVFPDDCDIMIAYSQPRDEDLVSILLSQGVARVYASPDYLHRNPIQSPEELSAHSCILLHSALKTDFNNWELLKAGDTLANTYHVTGKYVCDNAFTAAALARNGLGIFISPEYQVKEYLKRGEIAPCFNDDYTVSYQLVAIYKKREYQPLRVSCILDQLVDGIKKHINMHNDF